MDILLTDRHGEREFMLGSFQSFHPDVVENGGRKVRVHDRTVGHLYVKTERVPQERQRDAQAILEQTICIMEAWGEEVYLRKESGLYLDELQVEVGKDGEQILYGEKKDALTGVWSKGYFDERMQIIDRAEIAPVALIQGNINDWKFVNDNYGEEESDRLIRVVAGLLQEYAKPDYVIGRCDGDVFNIAIPMPEDTEAEEYCRKVKEAALNYEDDRLAPSVAMGLVYKTNVEEKIADKWSDAEYEMFRDKIDLKNAPGYRERLSKGLP